LIIFSLVNKLIWLGATSFQIFFDNNRLSWYIYYLKECFDSGSLGAILLENSKTFITEMLVILSISIFLYYPSYKEENPSQITLELNSN